MIKKDIKIDERRVEKYKNNYWFLRSKNYFYSKSLETRVFWTLYFLSNIWVLAGIVILIVIILISFLQFMYSLLNFQAEIFVYGLVFIIILIIPFFFILMNFVRKVKSNISRYLKNRFILNDNYLSVIEKGVLGKEAQIQYRDIVDIRIKQGLIHYITGLYELDIILDKINFLSKELNKFNGLMSNFYKNKYGDEIVVQNSSIVRKYRAEQGNLFYYTVYGLTKEEFEKNIQDFKEKIGDIKYD